MASRKYSPFEEDKAHSPDGEPPILPSIHHASSSWSHGPLTSPTNPAPMGGGSCMPRMSFFQLFSLAVLTSSLIFFTVDSLTERTAFRVVAVTLDKLRDSSTAVVCLSYMAIVTCLVTIGFPMTLLTVLGGYLFANLLGPALGIVIASIISFVAVTAGSMLSFLLGRTLLRSVSSECLHSNPTLEGLDDALYHQGLKINILLRLSPIVPYNIMNLAMGMTATRVDDYALGCLGMLPTLIVLSYFGSALAGYDDVAGYTHGHPVEMTILYSLGAVIVGLVTLLLYVYTKRAIVEASRRKASLVDSYGAWAGEL